MSPMQTSPTRSARQRQRLELIMQVRCGLLTVQEAARRMGTSRKTYYKWEKRFLQMGLLSQEEPEPRRRPPPDPDKEALREENRQLRRRIELLEQSLQIRHVMEAPDKKKRPNRRSHEPNRAIQTGSGTHLSGTVSGGGSTVPHAPAMERADAAGPAADRMPRAEETPTERPRTDADGRGDPPPMRAPRGPTQLRDGAGLGAGTDLDPAALVPGEDPAGSGVTASAGTGTDAPDAVSSSGRDLVDG